MCLGCVVLEAPVGGIVQTHVVPLLQPRAAHYGGHFDAVLIRGPFRCCLRLRHC